jgi:hypothetical protein
MISRKQSRETMHFGFPDRVPPLQKVGAPMCWPVGGRLVHRGGSG